MIILFLIFIVVAFLIIDTFGQTFIFPSRELKALETFYHSTGGEEWSWLPHYDRSGIPWDFSMDDPNPCLDHWQGLECDCVYRYQYLTSGYNATKDGNLYWHPNSNDWMKAGNTGYVPNGYYGYYYDTTVPYTDDELKTNLTDDVIECSISRIHLINYHLTGTLPLSIFELHNITSLQLDWNLLSGPLLHDEMFKNFPKLIELTVANNYFTGSLSNALFINENLQYLSIQHNYFSGNFPHEISLAPNFHMFEVGVNLLSGTLSNRLFEHCDNLNWFDISSNRFSGSIPESIGNCFNLYLINFRVNAFTGTIPLNLFQLSTLTELTLSRNFFTGSNILEQASRLLPLLSILEINHNLFSGTISSNISQLNELTYLWLNNNRFIGTLPETLFTLPKIYHLAVSSNQLTGTISSNINQLQQAISYLYLHNNSFTGTIPSSIPELINLYDLRLDMNSLHGVIPDLTGLNHLQSLTLAQNKLSGTIPPSLFGLPALETLFLQNNRLIGHFIPDNTLITPNMFVNIDVSNNFLSGSLPWDLFSASQETLITFVATSNLFETRLSPLLCEAVNLQVLVLNGLHTADVKITQVLTQKQHHFIPSCIFQLPNLQSLQLSGNGYKGSLEESFSNSINEISLSHNILTGTIPYYWLNHSWSLLDLSYNKLTGTLESHVNINPQTSTWKLLRNRLSGKLPGGKFREAQHIDVLIGNIFECGYHGQDIPLQDPNSKIYSCGTNMLNVQMYIALGLIVFTFMILIFISKYRWLFETYSLTSPIYICSKLTTQFLQTLIWFRKVIFLIGLVSLVILFTLYVLMSYYSSMYRYKYAYVLSSVFDSGINAGILFVMIWSIAFILFSFYINKLRRLQFVSSIHNEIPTSILSPQSFLEAFQKSNLGNSNIPEEKENIKMPFKELLFLNFTIACITLFLFGFSLLANVAYVYTQRIYSFLIRGMFQVAMALGKLIYNKFVTPYLYQFVFSFFHLSHEKRMHNNPFQIQLEVIVGFFTNIVAPVITETFVDDQCFYNRIFEASTPISSEYSYRFCTTWSFGYCYAYSDTSGSTTYQPLFEYSYQCSSSLMTNYLSVYFFMLLIDCFIKPIVTRGLKIMRAKLWKLSNSKLNWFSSSFEIILPTSDLISKELKKDEVITIPSIPIPPSPSPSLSPLKLKPSFDTVNDLSYKEIRPLNNGQQIRSIRFQQKEFIMHFILYLTILLTFGLMFPPLALLICYNSNLFLTRIINHITSQFQIIDQYQPILRQDIIHRQLIIKLSERKLIDSIHYIVRLMNFMVIPFAIMTTCWYLFDIFGDSLGWYQATLITIGFFIYVHCLHFLFVFGDPIFSYLYGSTYLSMTNENISMPKSPQKDIITPYDKLHDNRLQPNIEKISTNAIQSLLEDELSSHNYFPGYTSPYTGSKDDLEKQLYLYSKPTSPSNKINTTPQINIINEPEDHELHQKHFSSKQRIIIEKTHSAILHQASIDEYEEYKRIARLESIEDFQYDNHQHTKHLFNIFH